MAAPDFLFWPIPQLAALLRARKLSPVELTRACLNQIAAHDQTIKAFLTVTADRALHQARQAESEIAARRYRGVLHGIPYAPKDMLATKGIRTTNGSRVTAEWVPDFESTVTARLERAGAILLGKLNLLEFAMGSGQQGLQGPARNPWAPDYSPSGSSSGSGAALAAAMAPLTIGTDSGGSIRGPAKSCGVVGLKPTLGRVSRYGVTTLSWTLDHVGPLARTVDGVAAALEVIAGADTLDPACSRRAVPPYAKSLSLPLNGLRLGVAREHFFVNVQPEVDAALDQALRKFSELGAQVSEVTIPNAALCSTASAVILGAESAAYHEQRLKQSAHLLEPLVRERLEAGSCYSAVDYLKALRLRAVLIEAVRQLFRRVDVLFLPAGNPAPKLDTEIVETDIPPNPPPAPRPDVFNLANMTGIPALIVPCGFTSGEPKLPIAMQLCGRAFDEATLFRVGHAYQVNTDWHQRRPEAML
jgi:aspartyl-tRNA(Asn)/glutamyl-tRNA(Gln) amidotransferase subunit A